MRRSRLSQSVGQMVVRGLLLATVMVGVSVVACSSDSPDGIGNGNTVPTDGGTYACADGVTRACFVTLGEHNGVLSCYEGTQNCIEGGWTECSDGTITNKKWSGPYKPASGMRTMALTDAAACEDNPCDPTCQNFDEDPDVAFPPNAPEGGTVEMVGGSLSSIPPGLVKKGIIEPCEWGAHCQFNHRCVDVATNASCTGQHSKCVEGGALGGDCRADDPCVDAICDADPACCVGGTCAHDACVVGAKLSDKCDTCVEKVCAINSACCDTAWDATCVGLIATACAPTQTCACPAGATLLGGKCYKYDSTLRRADGAETACAAIGTGWHLATITSAADNANVDSLVPSGTNAWMGLKYIDSVWTWRSGGTLGSYTNWSGGTDPAQYCGRLNGSDGTWTSARCSNSNNTHPYVCEGPGALTNPNAAPYWDDNCVDMVATVCDATCGTTGVGVCVPNEEGYVDETCGTIDLALPVPCGDGNIIVCNHGTQEAPAGIPMVWYPGNSPHYGVCDPVAASNDGFCETNAVIPSGECISVPCGLFDGPQQGNNRQIYINPPVIGGEAADGYIANECSCLDNWVEARKGVPCMPPACADAAATATLKTVNMYLVVDKSTSMGFVGNMTDYNQCPNGYDCTCEWVNGNCECDHPSARWPAARTALTNVFTSPLMAGINVSLEFYPLPAAYGGNGCSRWYQDCDSVPCETPLVALDALQSALAPTDGQEFDLVSAMGAVCPIEAEAFGTPTYPALKGALKAARDHRTANSEEVHIAVLVTDGAANQCSPDSVDDEALAAYNAFTTNKVLTYVVGLGLETDATFVNKVNAIAAAGGTGTATIINPAVASELTTKLYDTILGIATNSASCSFPLPDMNDPNVGLYDPFDVTVLYFPSDSSNGNKKDLGTVIYEQSTTGTGGCDWYYDDPANPTEIILCDDACEEVQADPLAEMSVLLGCPSTYDPAEGGQIYQGTCPPGTRVQWGFFTYATTTPGDARVEFQFRTAETEADLVNVDFIVGTVAKTDPNPSAVPPETPAVCPITGVVDCPIDLYDTLGTPSALMPVIEVKALAYPTSTATQYPTVDDWQITYSCPSTE